MHAAMHSILTVETAAYLKSRHVTGVAAEKDTCVIESTDFTLAIGVCERCTCTTSGSSDAAVSDMHVGHCQTSDHLPVCNPHTLPHRHACMLCVLLHQDVQGGTCRRSAVKLPPLHMTDCAVVALAATYIAASE